MHGSTSLNQTKKFIQTVRHYSNMIFYGITFAAFNYFVLSQS